MKKIVFPFIIALPFLFLQSACKSSSRAQSPQEIRMSTLENDLKETWVLVWTNVMEVNAESFPDGIPYLELNPADSSVIGSTGCNQLKGKFNAGEEKELVFGEFAKTEMYCEDTPEIIYLDLLSEVTTYSREGLELTLHAGQFPVLRYKKAD